MGVDRRTFLGGLVAGTAVGPVALGATACSAAQGSSADPINVVDAFGFVPDGRTDNYEAFLRLARAASGSRNRHYLFPPGTYYVHRYRTPATFRKGGGGPIIAQYFDASDLTFSGAGAKIVLNGAFHRGPGEGRFNSAFMPFDFWRCRNIRIRGFEIDGGVRSMTRDDSTTEIYSHLIALNGCIGVTLEDLDLHHSQTDGVYLYSAGRSSTRAGTACRDVTLRRVTCRNNARGGFAPLQVQNLVATDCVFSGNGTDLGRYRHHAPGFGVDVEPDAWAPTTIDVLTGNLEFRRCRLDNNFSAFLAAYPSRYRGYLRLIDCTSSNRLNGTNHIIISWPGALLQGGRHDAGQGTVWTSWQNERGSDVIVRDTEIRVSGLYGLFHPFGGNLLTLERTRLIGTHRKAGTHGWVLAIQADPGGRRRNRLSGCEIVIPAARHAASPNYDYEVSLRHTVSEGNLFRTDLPARGNAHFAVDYGVGASARRDRFQGSASGPADGFRPWANANHDTRTPFSKE
jgi:hypothetical protein